MFSIIDPSKFTPNNLIFQQGKTTNLDKDKETIKKCFKVKRLIMYMKIKWKECLMSFACSV